jgi:pimeloyl-ACP methyl ester carboxylesterase
LTERPRRREPLPLENSNLLAHHLPHAQLRIYSDAGHGFLGQYPKEFADHVNAFLEGA